MNVLDCPICGSNTVLITKTVTSVTHYGPKGTVAQAKRAIGWSIKCHEDKCTVNPEISIDSDDLEKLISKWNKRNFARNYLIPKYRCLQREDYST